MTQLLADTRTFTLEDAQVFDAFQRPELYDWSPPDEYETAVFNALEIGEGFVRDRQSVLLDTALRQVEPVRITRALDGWKVTRPI